MSSVLQIAEIASLLGDPARVNMMLALSDGRALPAGELALAASVAPASASGHLSQLVGGGLLTVAQQGRHRYYRIAGPEVAGVIETLSLVSPAKPVRSFRQSREAEAIRFRSFDGTYTENMTLDQARADDVIVALTMYGEPVTHDHGGPVRIYSASMYGYKSTKWLSGIELTQRNIPGYWEDRGYPLDGIIGE